MNSFGLLLNKIVTPLTGEPGIRHSERQLGRRLALCGPVVFYLILIVGALLLGVRGEASVGVTLTYWLFIGAVQSVYIIPAIVTALLLKRRDLAWGCARGAGLVVVATALAWGVGVLVLPRLGFN